MVSAASGRLAAVRAAWLITGLPGAGKSTIASLFASTMPRAAVISGDVLAGCIVSGAVQPGQEPRAEARSQQLLTVDHQCLLARSFAGAGFVPIVEYVVVERSRLERYRAALADVSLHVVVLNPSRDVILQRDGDRAKESIAHHFVHLQRVLCDELTGVGLWIDSSELTADETVRLILQHADEARV